MKHVRQYRYSTMDSTAERQFSKLDKSTKKRIVDKLDSIVDNQFLYVTRLVGFNVYKSRSCSYRIILAIEKKSSIVGFKGQTPEKHLLICTLFSQFKLFCMGTADKFQSRQKIYQDLFCWSFNLM